jgi:hypothetical protein
MKLLALGLSALLGFVTACKNAESKGKKDIDLSWSTEVTVEVEVVSYTKGAPGEFLTVRQNFHLRYPSNIAMVKVLSPAEFTGVQYTISIPDIADEQFDPRPWREPGRRLTVTLPLVYLKYRPWDFIPYDSIKTPNQALEPTPTAVTPRADARVAPAAGVAHL